MAEVADFEVEAPPLSPSQVLVDVLPVLRTTTGIWCPAPRTWLNTWEEVTHEHVSQMTLANVIIHLNDDHEWEREKLADWLDTLDIDLSFPGETE